MSIFSLSVVDVEAIKRTVAHILPDDGSVRIDVNAGSGELIVRSSPDDAKTIAKVLDWLSERHRTGNKRTRTDGVPDISEQDIRSMSDTELRQVVVGLCKGIGTLERRVHELEKANKLRIVPCAPK